jgi:hypothetical protein
MISYGRSRKYYRPYRLAPELLLLVLIAFALGLTTARSSCSEAGNGNLGNMRRVFMLFIGLSTISPSSMRSLVQRR